MEVLDYETLVADFENKLMTKLRSFGADAEYLEMWVPDDDPVKSILNMVEAAQAFGRDAIAVHIASNAMSPDRVDELVARVGGLGKVCVSRHENKITITVTEIGSR